MNRPNPPAPALGDSASIAALAAGAAFVEGRVMPIAEASVPILDAGFARSDLTYDVVAVWRGSFFRLDEHLDRFERNCGRLRLDPGYDRAQITEILEDLVRQTGLTESFVEMVCTRGIAHGGERDPRKLRNRFYAYAIPYVWLLRWEERDSGMDAVVVREVERISPRAVDPTVKNFHWGDLVRGLYEAYDRGGRFPVLLDGDGNVTEGAGYNLFALEDGVLWTPASGVLDGITRRTVLELAEEAGLETRVTDVPVERLYSAPELFATSTAGGVMAIGSLDGQPVGAGGGVGPMTRQLRDRYWALHVDSPFTTPIDYRRSATSRP